MLTSLLAFAAAGALVVVLPGPDSLMMLRSIVAGGRRRGLAAAAGILTGLTVWAGAAALGISAVLKASHWGWLGLRVAGAVYLVAMGVQALLAHRRTSSPSSTSASDADAKATGEPEPAPAPAGRRRGLLGTGYRAGLTTDLLNPKVGVFFMTFLPAFLPHGQSPAGMSVALGAIFVVETAVYLGIMLLLVERISAWLASARFRRRLDRVTGTVLIGFGLRLAVER